jgi:hypothetical protein
MKKGAVIRSFYEEEGGDYFLLPEFSRGGVNRLAAGGIRGGDYIPAFVLEFEL